MATVTGKTSIKIDDLINDTIISGEVNPSGLLLLTTRGGAVINAGQVTPDSSDFVTKDSQVFNVKDYGVVGDGVTDDTAALNAASAVANAAGGNARLFIPNGTYKITGTVSISCGLDADQATLSYSGSGTALVVGVNSSGVVTARRRFYLPRVVKPSQDWDGTSIGVKLVNLNTCDIYVPFVQNFETGLLVYGFGQGSTYNTITLGALWQNHRNLVIDSDLSGWSNQNLYLGGRLQQSVSGAGAMNDDLTSFQIKLGETPGTNPNQNTFINTSIEGNNPAYYRLDVNGQYNKWINCRWENMGGESRVRWGANALYNTIEHGYEADELVEEFVSGSAGNEVRDRFGAYIKANKNDGMTIPNNIYTTITGWFNDSRRAPYVTGNGSWTPRQGRWRISATVGFLPGATGSRAARLLVGGSTTLDAAMLAGSTTQQTLKLQANHRFDGNTSLVLQAYQNSGGDLGISTTTGFVTLHAEWVGP